VPGHEPAAWASALTSLVVDESARMRLAAGARLHAHRFGWATTAQHLLDCYDQARGSFESRRLSLLPEAL
jgi:D-inositol-3-phosphate glycosyltransferase